MASLPLRLPPEQMMVKWKSQIDPLLNIPMLKGLQLDNVILNNGVTVINHLLGRQQQGWMITDINGAAQIYRSQPFNNLTLTLTSDAVVTVNLWVY